MHVHLGNPRPAGFAAGRDYVHLPGMLIKARLGDFFCHVINAWLILHISNATATIIVL